MVAHKGMCLDHVVLVKTMIMCDLSLPLWRFSDTLPIFELVIKPGSSEELSDLVIKPGPSAELSDFVRDYVPWLTPLENDAVQRCRSAQEFGDNWSLQLRTGLPHIQHPMHRLHQVLAEVRRFRCSVRPAR